MKELLLFNKPHTGVLLKRYKRFFADIQLDDGPIVTAHCTNTGSMLGVCIPNQPVVLSEAENPDRKLRYTWEAIRTPELKQNQWIGINTANPNKLVWSALKSSLLPFFPDSGNEKLYRIEKEVKINKETRLDFCITNLKTDEKFYIEVKNVTLSQGLTALFPDSVSERATKHLLTLEALVKAGHKAMVLFISQRPDCTQVAAAHAIDPTYGATLHQVIANGVEAKGFYFIATQKGLCPGKELKVICGDSNEPNNLCIPSSSTKNSRSRR